MLALLCGGQGLVSSRMFDLVAEAPAAAPVFASAARLFGQDPRQLVLDMAGERLRANRENQVLSVTAALATHAAIADLLPPDFAVTGYSVGEMAAWSIAGVWSAEQALNLTDQRARIMDDASIRPGRLVYVRGLAQPIVETIAARHGAEIAIINPGNLFVLGITEDDALRLCQDARASGALKAEPLAVHVAAHTSFLQSGVQPFLETLRAGPAAVAKDGRILLAGSGGARVFRPDTAIDRLASQIAAPVDWAGTIDALAEYRVTSVLDLGPGAALGSMVQGAQSTIRAYAATAFHSLEGLRSWLSNQAN